MIGPANGDRVIDVGEGSGLETGVSSSLPETFEV